MLNYSDWSEQKDEADFQAQRSGKVSLTHPCRSPLCAPSHARPPVAVSKPRSLALRPGLVRERRGCPPSASRATPAPGPPKRVLAPDFGLEVSEATQRQRRRRRQTLFPVFQPSSVLFSFLFSFAFLRFSASYLTGKQMGVRDAPFPSLPSLHFPRMQTSRSARPGGFTGVGGSRCGVGRGNVPESRGPPCGPGGDAALPATCANWVRVPARRARRRWGRWSARLGLLARGRWRAVSCVWLPLGAVPVSLMERNAVAARCGAENVACGAGGREDAARERPRGGGAVAAHLGAALRKDCYFEIRRLPLRGAGCKGQVSLPLAVNLRYSL